MYFISRKNKKTLPETYRDEWDDDDLIIQAHEDFVKYIPELAQEQKLSRWFFLINFVVAWKYIAE